MLLLLYRRLYIPIKHLAYLYYKNNYITLIAKKNYLLKFNDIISKLLNI